MSSKLTIVSLDDTVFKGWNRFHHPDWSFPVVRRRAREEVLDILSGLGSVLVSGGRSILWSQTYPTTQAYRSAMSRLRKQGLIVRVDGRKDLPLLTLSDVAKQQRPAYQNPEKHWKMKWNGIWYMLIFDVPEKDRPYRDTLRRFLKHLRMGCLQKSVWITPCDIRPDYADLEETAAIDAVAYLLESRTVLHLDQQEMVQNAWDFERLHKLQARYIDVFGENLSLLKQLGHCEEDLIALLHQESEAYAQAMILDPLLPTALLPDNYLGKNVWNLRNQLRTHIANSLASCVI